MKLTLEAIFLVYFFILNLIGFAAMGIDKQKAIRGLWRIPEKNLFAIAIFGGSIGTILGMQVFRHKTKHPSFAIGMPAIFLLQAMIAYFVFL